MEMEMEIRDELSVAVERLAVAAGMLETAAERIAGLQVSASSSSSELEERLRLAEATIASLRAERGEAAGRKTLPAGVVALLAKGEGRALDLAGIDAALTGLSMEQRIAVKAQLMRTGLI